jgi:hypothetical protein
MFYGSQGNSVLRYLILHAWATTDSPCMTPQVSWGAAVLAVTYMGLCEGVAKGTSSEGIFLGCPLLLHLLSYKHLLIGPSSDSTYSRSRSLATTQSAGPSWARCGATDEYMLLTFYTTIFRSTV